jgi:hypothetical protein
VTGRYQALQAAPIHAILQANLTMIAARGCAAREQKTRLLGCRASRGACVEHRCTGGNQPAIAGACPARCIWERSKAPGHNIHQSSSDYSLACRRAGTKRQKNRRTPYLREEGVLRHEDARGAPYDAFFEADRDPPQVQVNNPGERCA